MRLLRKVLLVTVLSLSLGGAREARAQFNKNYFFWVGRNHLMDNSFEAAIETLNILLRVDEDLHEAYFLRGVAKYNLGDYLGAETDFTTAIEKNPVYTMAYNFRAITRAQLGNYDDSLKDFQEAIDLRPDLPGPYYSRGMTYLLSGQYQKAIDDLDQFIMQENKVIDAYIVRGEAYLNLKDTTRAYEEYNTAIRTNRYSPSGYFRRGLLHSMQGDDRRALEDFNTAIDRDSTYTPAIFSRAIVYNDTDRPMDALADMDRVIELDSTYMLAYFNRALMRTQIGDYNRAMEDYDRVAMYNPNNVLVYYNRAALHSYLGDVRAAIADYTRAIELYPDFANAYLYRSQLRALTRDEHGSREDRRFAERKIAEYRSKLADSTFSIYADTSRNFNRLLTFDTPFARGEMAQLGNQDENPVIKPLFRFSLLEQEPQATVDPKRYVSREMDVFVAEVGMPFLRLTTAESDILADSLIMIDRAIEAELASNTSDWLSLFRRGVTQSLIRQYTNSVNAYTAAIEKNPSNPFLYLNRSTTRSDMIDFISSMDNSFQRINVDGDRASQLKSSSTRTYSYDEAISDLNKAAKLLPDFAYIYYNRANLHTKSGRLPEAYDDYTRAIELHPNFAEAYFNRGLVQIYMKDTRKGLLDLSKAGELGINEAYLLLKVYSAQE